MTVCAPALPTKKIPLCILVLTVGTISSLNANITIFIIDITTGRKFTFQATTDGAGLITVDLSAVEFAENHSYELWVTLQNASIEDKEDITIGTETAQNIAIGFMNLLDGEDCLQSNATLEAA